MGGSLLAVRRAGNSRLTEFAADIILCVLFFGFIEDLIGIAIFDKITGAPSLSGVNVKEAGLVGHPLGLLEIVGDDGDGVALLQLQHQLLNPARRDGVEGRTGLVHQQNLRLSGNGAGDAQALLLTSGKRETATVQLVFDFVPQGGLAKGLLNALFPVSLVTVKLQAKGHVPVNAHGKRVWLLKYHADMAADSHRVYFGLVYIYALKVYVSFKAESPHHVVHPVKATQHRALAAPGRSDEGRDLASLDRDTGISYGFELTVEQFFDVAVDNRALAVIG